MEMGNAMEKDGELLDYWIVVIIIIINNWIIIIIMIIIMIIIITMNMIIKLDCCYYYHYDYDYSHNSKDYHWNTLWVTNHGLPAIGKIISGNGRCYQS